MILASQVYRKKSRGRNQFRPLAPRIILVTASKLGWIFLLLITLVTFAWVIFSDFFTIKHILCLQGDRPCSQEVEAELASLKGKSLLTFRSDHLEASLAQAEIGVGEVKVQPQLPHTLQITLTSRGSSLSLGTATDSATILIDAQLTPFQLEPKPSQPAQIISPQVKHLSLGQPIVDPSLLAAIKLAQTLDQHFIGFNFIQAFQNRLQLVLKNKSVVIFAIDSDFANLLPSLQLILQQTKIEPPKQIDLRFGKPVLKF